MYISPCYNKLTFETNQFLYITYVILLVIFSFICLSSPLSYFLLRVICFVFRLFSPFLFLTISIIFNESFNHLNIGRYIF